MKATKLRSLIVVLALIAAPLAAEPAWVTDRLFLSLYPEPDTSSDRLSLLQSGDELERLGERENGFAQVELADGTVGWVNEDFLVDNPPARLRIDSVETERDRLADELENRSSQVNQLNSQLEERNRVVNQLQSRVSELEASLAEVDVDTAGDGESVEPRTVILQTQPFLTMEENAPAPEPRPTRASNESLEDNAGVWALSSTGLWQAALIGAGLLLGGLLLGGLGGYLLRERKVRQRFGGLSL